MLELLDLCVEQGDFTLAANMAFTAPITALVGPSGAGKSTLLNVIAGHIAPQQGRIHWRGEDISELAPAKRPLAMLFQDNNLFPHLDVAQNLALAVTRGRPDADDRARIADALSRVELPGVEDRMPAQLSGGQQSRVALARALLQARPLMLLDEPFAALGPALRREMLDLVASMSAAHDIHTIMVSHDPQDAKRIANDIAVVAEGRVESPGPTAQILNNPPPALARYLGRSDEL